MNSSVLENNIRRSPVLQRIYIDSPDIETIANKITLLTLSRRATRSEIDIYKKHMDKNQLPLMEVAIDIMWMQINSNEFLYNH
jgi:hypothetical protein